MLLIRVQRGISTSHAERLSKHSIKPSSNVSLSAIISGWLSHHSHLPMKRGPAHPSPPNPGMVNRSVPHLVFTGKPGRKGTPHRDPRVIGSRPSGSHREGQVHLMRGDHTTGVLVGTETETDRGGRGSRERPVMRCEQPTSKHQ